MCTSDCREAALLGKARPCRSSTQLGLCQELINKWNNASSSWVLKGTGHTCCHSAHTELKDRLNFPSRGVNLIDGPLKVASWGQYCDEALPPSLCLLLPTLRSVLLFHAVPLPAAIAGPLCSHCRPRGDVSSNPSSSNERKIPSEYPYFNECFLVCSL